MEVDVKSMVVTDENDKHERALDEQSNGAAKKRKHGGIRTMPFILANEVCDRFASSGFHANMITYLTQVLNLPLVQASNTLSNFSGTGSFTPLLGALLADAVAGRYWTIIIGSIFYELGLVSIVLSAVLPSLRPPACPTQVNCQEASTTQLWVFYISPSSHLPRFRRYPPLRRHLRRRSVRHVQVQGCLPQVELLQLDNVGWGWGLGIPAVAMAISVVAFVLGSRLYVKLKPGGSPLTRLAQVIVAAVKKRNVPVPEDPGLLYENKELDAVISVHGRLLHSEQFKWLDKAATMTEEEARSSGPPNLWRLVTVHRVEELKCIVRMLPIWAAGILLVTCSSHLGSFTIVQARSMDRHLSHSFQIPPASLSIFSIVTMLSGLVLYERVFVPFIRRFTGNPVGITCLQRMGIGFTINILGAIVASFVEIKRKKVAAAHHLLDAPKAIIPISVFWLVPQYVIHGIAEVFMSVGHLEFLYDQSPESMRSTAAALYWVAISVGHYLGTLLVTLVHDYTGKERNWLPDRNLNRGRLERYYWLVSGIQVVNLVYYLVCASLYTYKPVEESICKEEEEAEPAKDDVLAKNMANGTNGNAGEMQLIANAEKA
ncbi:hypothetical protein NL676_017071 [Syzygium grande]|nr:hypothetical protein NL676_017071 [Syzygium grande]